MFGNIAIDVTPGLLFIDRRQVQILLLCLSGMIAWQFNVDPPATGKVFMQHKKAVELLVKPAVTHYAAYGRIEDSLRKIVPVLPDTLIRKGLLLHTDTSHKIQGGTRGK